MSKVSFSLVWALVLGPSPSTGSPADTGTKAQREALFEEIIEKTLDRESFSPIKNRRLGLDVEAAMRAVREDVVAAESDESLYYALVELSNARKDRHLTVELVPGGLDFERAREPDQQAPVRFFGDFGDPDSPFVFVRDTATDIEALTEGEPPRPGDRVVGVNGRTFDAYFAEVEPYHRYSTPHGLLWHFADLLSTRSYRFPGWIYEDRLRLELEDRSGRRYRTSLPYLAPDVIRWRGRGDRVYPGFDLAYSTTTYDLYRNFEGRDVIVLAWHGFREHLKTDVDRLVEYATAEGLLGHAVVFDGTRSRGGSMGAYAVERLSPKRFRTTFGNLRLSDVTTAFIESARKDAGDGDRWLIDWLEGDVLRGLEAGQGYSNDVPFKLAHLPEYSDGWLDPAPVHFEGPLVCLLGPQGGSHLDQFAAMIIDNDLGHTIGMPAGGYSNTWEWEEVLVMPGTDRPLVRFMWSIGHTLRPNGEILEGNPAEVHEPVPLTRDNFETYHGELLERAYRYLELSVREGSR